MAEGPKIEGDPQQGQSLASFDTRSLITVKEARKILGKEFSEQLSDKELRKIILNMERIAFTLARNSDLLNNIVKKKEYKK